MLVNLVIKKGGAKTYTTEYKPIEKQSNPLLDAIYPDSEWLWELPFMTNSLILFISDRPLEDDKIAIKLPPVPFAKSTKNKTRFEIQNDRGQRLRSSKEYPVTQLFLYNVALDPSIIDELKSIYLGISPLSTPAESDPQGASQDEPTTASDADRDEDDHDQGDRDRDREAAMDYLDNFIRYHVIFRKDGKLTSLQILTAILNVAPDNVPTEYIYRAHITRAVKARHGIVMEKESTRIDGHKQTYWRDFTILLD